MTYKKDVHEWRDAVTVLNSSSHEFPGMEENILSILKFSYDGLEDENIKSCFLYCSLFPEDYEIKKEELIEFWICERFINENRDEDGSNKKGHAIIGSLVHAHLLMDIDGEFTTMVKMHDVIREMTLWIGSNLGEGEKNLVKSGAQLGCVPEDINWKYVRRISLMSNQIKEISGCPLECPNLSTLLLRNNDLRSILGEFFQFMPALVVLDLSKNEYLCYLPEISNLTSLEYLNLSATRIRLLQMKGLRKLISLDLENTLSLRSIDGIRSLQNLQVLKLYHSGVCVDARLMEELQLLKHLTILTATIKDALILECIQGMERLASCVQRLAIEHISAQVVTLDTVALGGLQELTIGDSKISESKEKEELICPTSPCFKHLSTVIIDSLEGPKDLTWLLLVPNLRTLIVSGSRSIEEIINGEKGISISKVHPDISLPFQKLEVLRLSNMSGLKRICPNPPSLPNLRQSLVEDCPKLPKDATEFTSASGSNDMTITQVREGDE